MNVMLKPDSFFTIEMSTIAEDKISGSSFISLAFHVSTMEEIEFNLNATRKKYYDATHHCYTWSLFDPIHFQNETKSSDDGEPSGTAGKPILNVLTGSGITNCLIIVVRYFGGIKLGTGGLVRAYSNGAKNVLQSSIKKEVFLYEFYSITIDYDFISPFQNLIAAFKIKIVENSFADRVFYKIGVLPSVVDSFKLKIVEMSNGKYDLEK